MKQAPQGVLPADNLLRIARDTLTPDRVNTMSTGGSVPDFPFRNRNIPRSRNTESTTTVENLLISLSGSAKKIIFPDRIANCRLSGQDFLSFKFNMLSSLQIVQQLTSATIYYENGYHLSCTHVFSEFVTI
jgi:hypothetical protein